MKVSERADWKIFLNRLPEDISDKILRLVFEKNIQKTKKDLINEFESIKYFIYYLLQKY